MTFLPLMIAADVIELTKPKLKYPCESIGRAFTKTKS